MKIVIVGAGISGLAAAHHLREAGHEAVIYEASDRAGGRGMLLNRPGTDDWADVGSQYYHSNYTHGLKLIEDLGLTSKLKKIEGASRVFTSETDSYVMEVQRPWMKDGGILGNLRVGFYISKLLWAMRSSSPYAPLKNKTAFDRTKALDSTSSAFVKDRAVRTMSLAGGLNEPADADVSKLQMARWTKIMMTTDSLSLIGGTATLHDRLAKQSDIRLNRPVKGLIETEGRVSGIELDNGERVQADHVVVAADVRSAANIAPADWSFEQAFLSGVKMLPTHIVSFFLDRQLEEGVWSYIMPMGHQGPVSFCVDAQQKSPVNHPSGKATLQAWIVSPKSLALVDKSDSEIADIALQDIAPFMTGVVDAVEGSHVKRHYAALPQTSVGHNERVFAFLDAIDQRPGVSFCGDYFSGGYIESALWSVDRAMPLILSDLARSNTQAMGVDG
ncbi:MAG: NAD(P)/FAD-dependent oxidoreductase [Pseudomonadota bacterium]